MDEPDYQHGDLLARGIEQELPWDPGAGPDGAPVDLKILDDEVVVAFPNLPDGGADGGADEIGALAAVFAAESPRGRELLGESYFHPGRFYLDGVAESGDGAFDDPTGEGPVRLVVDASPGFDDEELYERVGALVVPDERAAAEEIARRVWAAEERALERERERKRAAARRENRGGQSRLERLRAEIRAASSKRPALSTGQLEENLRKSGRGGPKKRGIVRGTILGILASLGLVRLDEEETERPEGPTWRRRIPERAAELIMRSPFPGVAVITNNKGGTGKTTVATNLAVAAARIARPRGWDDGLPVLLVEQNYGNSDIRDRIKTPGAIGRGLTGFVEDFRAGRKPEIVDYVTPVSGFDNLDALLISDRDDEHEHAGTITETDLDALYESAADYYRLIVVDLDKGLPQEVTMVADVLRFWLTVSDVTYLIHDASKDSLKAALKVAQGARNFFAHEAATGGEPRPLVPVRNKWREGEERWGASADDEEEWEGWVALLGADWAVDRDGRRVSFLKIPDDPQCDAFSRQQRQIALADWDFALAFEELSREWIDRVVKSRLAQEEQDAADEAGSDGG